MNMYVNSANTAEFEKKNLQILQNLEISKKSDNESNNVNWKHCENQ